MLFVRHSARMRLGPPRRLLPRSVSAAVGQSGRMSSLQFDESFNDVFLYCNPKSLVKDVKGKDLCRIVVFYDGGCDICLKEVNHYNTLNSRPEDCLIAFFDLCSISGTPQILLKHGVEATAPFHRLHVLTEYGTVLTSMNAFCEVWNRLPYWRHVVPVVRNVPGVKQISDFMYATIADFRLKYWPSKIEEFKQIDTDGNGKISKEELKILLHKLGEKNVTEKTIESVMKAADIDGDGYLSYDEFVQYFYKQTAAAPHPGRKFVLDSSVKPTFNR